MNNPLKCRWPLAPFTCERIKGIYIGAVIVILLLVLLGR